MEPVDEPDLGPQAKSGRDRRLEGGPPLPRIVSGKDGIAIRVEPVVMIQEGKPERNSPEVIWQLAGELPVITTVATGDRRAVRGLPIRRDQDCGAIRRIGGCSHQQ